MTTPRESVTLPVYQVQFTRTESDLPDRSAWRQVRATGLFDAAKTVLRRMGDEALPLLEGGSFIAWVVKPGAKCHPNGQPMEVTMLPLGQPAQANPR